MPFKMQLLNKSVLTISLQEMYVILLKARYLHLRHQNYWNKFSMILYGHFGYYFHFFSLRKLRTALPGPSSWHSAFHFLLPPIFVASLLTLAFILIVASILTLIFHSDILRTAFPWPFFRSIQPLTSCCLPFLWHHC